MGKTDERYQRRDAFDTEFKNFPIFLLQSISTENMHSYQMLAVVVLCCVLINLTSAYEFPANPNPECTGEKIFAAGGDSVCGSDGKTYYNKLAFDCKAGEGVTCLYKDRCVKCAMGEGGCDYLNTGCE